MGRFFWKLGLLIIIGIVLTGEDGQFEQVFPQLAGKASLSVGPVHGLEKPVLDYRQGKEEDDRQDGNDKKFGPDFHRRIPG